MKRTALILALALAALALPSLVAAQTGATLTLRHLETQAFPLLAGYLVARDSTGARIADLQAVDVHALEDGVAVPIDQLRVVEPGLRIIVVLNPAESFAIRDSQARTRFDYVKENILAWANDLPSSSSTFLSLITPEGILLNDAPVTDWATALDGIDPNFGSFEVSTQALEQALELAAQPGLEPGTGTAIWWVTSTPRAETLASLPDWQAALAERGIPLFIWQVDSPTTFESEAAQTLKAFAQASGGLWFGFSGGEPFPGPEDYFFPLRSAYFFQYSSQLHSAGTHQVQLQMEVDGTAVVSQALSFDLDIQPPNPILVSPPTQIERSPSDEDPQQLAPFSQPIEILVEFPDNFERNIVRSALYVNDERVAENTSAPFTRFVWDLSGYTVSQQVTLRVEAEDELGLVGSSIDFPVQLLVENPLSWFQALISRGGPALVLSGVLVAAAAFFLVMILSGRLKPTRLGANTIFRRTKPAAPAADPLNDSPLSIGQEADASHTASWVGAVPEPVHEAPAYLQRLAMQDATESAAILPIDQQEVLIGSDKDCTIVLQEDSVQAQHARLYHLREDLYHVTDLGSEAGTWVNYAPVSAEGSRLQDGDLLHIGRVAFRFLLNTSWNGSGSL